MAVLGPYVSANMNGHNNIHSQLSKSLERILEDAYLCGELKLSGRKLKELPKPAKFDLTDTVIADLSKNRFSEVPNEVTTFVFLEKLLLSQNVIKSMPDGMGGLQSLTYLDLSSNQLTEIPREICQMPLQVLLVNDNLLTNLPKDIGRMTSLAELDASNNRLTQVPMALGDCSGLKALDLSCNQLGLLPLQITYLRLEHLDVSNNCISSLPLELRNMTTLVTLNLDNNPLVSPPITVCMRGRVHIFKYLENTANKDNLPVTRRLEDTRRPNKHNSYLGNTPQQSHPGITSGNATIDCLRHKPRHVIDSGYCTDGIDKRWSNEGGSAGGGSGRSSPATPATLSPAPLSRQHSLSSEAPLAPLTPLLTGLRISPEGNISNGDDRSKLHQQTYRQYKEALRQQRQQDIYRPREQPSPELPDSSPIHQSPLHHSPIHNGFPSNVSPSLYRSVSSNSNISSPSHAPTSPLHSTPRRFQNQNGNIEKVEENKRPVQKVVPSRNVTKSYSLNGSIDYNRVNGQNDCLYTKPTSPTKSPTNILGYNSIGGKPRSAINGESPMLLTATYLKGGGTKSPGKMVWNNEPLDKLSFTMKREFDKQKEESDLLHQLRSIIESRLKVSLGASLSGALCDGVVLCHLANHVRPRAVASVHVPSPAQPKLTMARCRRNVENFIEACRKIGVEEEVICSPEDVMASEGDGAMAALARTVTALLAHATPRSTTHNQSDHTYQHIDQSENATRMDYQSESETQSLYQHYDQQEEYYASQLREADIEVNYYQRRRYGEDRYISNFNSQFGNETIDEADEYYLNYENNNTSTPVQNTYNQVYGCNEGIRNRGQYYQGNRVQFVMPFCKDNGVYTSENFEIYDIDEVDCPTELRENMHRYDKNKMNLNIKKNYEKELNDETEKNTENDNRMLATCLCLGTFFVSAILLILFPL